MRKWTKRFLMTAILSMTAISLAACGSDDESADGNELELIFKAPDDIFKEWMEDTKEQFEKEHEGVNVKITEVKADEGEYPNKKVLMMKSDKTSPDIVMEDSESLKADSAAGY